MRLAERLQTECPRAKVGRGTYGGVKVLDWSEDAGDNTPLTIGAFCSFAAGTIIMLGGEHPMQYVTTFPLNGSASLSKGPVVIGNDVWFGVQALVFSGVTIGDGAVVGARAVVTRDVPPYTIVAGSPARVIRPRFDPAIAKELLRIAWWDWTEDRIAKAVPYLLGPPEAFIAAVDRNEI